MADLAGDLHHRRRKIDRAVGLAEAHLDAALGLDPLQLLQKIDVKVGAAILAVGDALQANRVEHAGRRFDDASR